MEKEKAKGQREFKKRVYEFTLELIATLHRLPKRDFVAHRLGNQLLRSGTSITGNYIEGISGSSRKDLANYFSTCLKSSNESKLWLCLLRDSKRLSRELTAPLISELNELSKIFASSLLTLQKN